LELFLSARATRPAFAEASAWLEDKSTTLEQGN
jgi:hypothetical protein